MITCSVQETPNDVTHYTIDTGKMLSISEMGNGWAPVVINSQEEYDFLRQGQKTIRNSVPYWINGSTNAQQQFGLEHYRSNYTDYVANDSGMIQ